MKEIDVITKKGGPGSGRGRRGGSSGNTAKMSDVDDLQRRKVVETEEKTMLQQKKRQGQGQDEGSGIGTRGRQPDEPLHHPSNNDSSYVPPPPPPAAAVPPASRSSIATTTTTATSSTTNSDISKKQMYHREQRRQRVQQQRGGGGGGDDTTAAKATAAARTGATATVSSPTYRKGKLNPPHDGAISTSYSGDSDNDNHEEEDAKPGAVHMYGRYGSITQDTTTASDNMIVGSSSSFHHTTTTPKEENKGHGHDDEGDDNAPVLIEAELVESEERQQAISQQMISDEVRRQIAEETRRQIMSELGNHHAGANANTTDKPMVTVVANPEDVRIVMVNEDGGYSNNYDKKENNGDDDDATRRKKKKSQRKRRMVYSLLCCLALLLVIIVGGVVGALTAMNNKKKDDDGGSSSSSQEQINNKPPPPPTQLPPPPQSNSTSPPTQPPPPPQSTTSRDEYCSSTDDVVFGEGVVGMTLQSWYFGHEGDAPGSGKADICEELCRYDNRCYSWMWRNSGNTCYLSEDKYLTPIPIGCCSDHHAYTFNKENCSSRNDDGDATNTLSTSSWTTVEGGGIEIGPGSYYVGDDMVTIINEDITDEDTAWEWIRTYDYTDNPIVMWQLGTFGSDPPQLQVWAHRLQFMKLNLDASTGRSPYEFTLDTASFIKDYNLVGGSSHVRNDMWWYGLQQKN